MTAAAAASSFVIIPLRPLLLIVILFVFYRAGCRRFLGRRHLCQYAVDRVLHAAQGLWLRTRL